MKVDIAVILFLIFLLGSSCEENISVKENKAVIEGVFSSEGYPTVLFSSSVSPGVDGNLSDAVINWGKVTISDGEREVILSGRVDNTYLPPFRYYTYDMKGEPGKTYTVKADFKDLHAESTMTMPHPTPIDSITFAPTETDTLRATTLHFTSPADTPAYYYLTLQRNERGAHPSPTLMGTIIADLPLTHYSIPVLKPKIKINSSDPGLAQDFVPQLTVGDEWIVELNRVERPVYDFWKAYDNMILFSTSPFISTNESLPTNINGGYGVWSPQGTTSMLFKVL